MSAFAQILGAIIHRLKTGKGQSVTVPMFETMAHLVLSDHLGGKTFSSEGESGYVRLLSADRKPYPTRDGYLCVMVYNDNQWKRFLHVVGRADLADNDPRFANMTSRSAHIDEVYGIVGAMLREKPTAEWIELLDAADIPVAPMRTIETLLADEQLAASGLVQWVDHPSEGRVVSLGVPSIWSESQPTPAGHAPRFGEHSIAILEEFGISREEIDELLAGRHVFDAQQSENAGDATVNRHAPSLVGSLKKRMKG
jgi:crotonobetainyl-CoA:carnitine CoA-transferase CaiB-like acyl-CoA transferase